MDFTLTKPCPHCPFRTDIVQPRLTPAHASRVKAIARAVIEDGVTFACHKTNCLNAQGEPLDTDEVQFCAGAMILIEKMGRPHEALQAAKHGRRYDPAGLHLDAPVYDTLAEMLEDMDRPTYGATPARDARPDRLPPPQ